MSRRFFCTFADSRLKRSLNRIELQASRMKVYDDIFICNENDLEAKFASRFKDYLKLGSRGYGYWCWKPQIILQTLNVMNEGDILQYTDTGCHLNYNGRKRLLEYFDIAKKSKSGILAFRSKNLDEVSEGETFYGNLEYKYTKGDVLQYFGVFDNNIITHTTMYEGGIIFLRKDPQTIDFIKKWIAVFESNFNLIDDTPSIFPNIPGFVDNRHDQSIYSILCKLNQVETLFTSEYYTDKDWNTLDKYPIWVKWDKDFGFYHKVKNFIRRKYSNLFKLKLN